MTRSLTATLLCASLAISFSCQKKTPPGTAASQNRQDANVTKIMVMRNGDILVDGNSTTIADLRSVLEETKSRSGDVWYYRQQADRAPPPQAMEVFKMIIEMKLPISLSTKPDFSDYVDNKGVSHPRP